MAGLVKTHILTLKAVIDAQAAGDLGKAYMDERTAAAHMQMIADPLAAAIAKQFPAKFPMNVTTNGVAGTANRGTGTAERRAWR